MLSGGFPVLLFSTIDLEKKLDELCSKFQMLRMKGEYKMFIDSLSERNKSKILLLLMNASTSYSNHMHFQGELFLSKDSPASFIVN